jgi:hypothetical protein
MRALLSRCIIAVVIACAVGSTAAPTFGKADQQVLAAREGCMSQWMFNGIWRVRVTKADPLLDDGGKQIGWLVTEQWRNGTKRTFAPGDTFAKDQTLMLSNGATITAVETTNGTLSSQDVLYHQFPAAAQYTHEQKFIAAGSFDPSIKPAAVVIPFDTAQQTAHKDAPQYSVSPANYKIKLDCTATAEQQAQGGSYQVPAQEGCLNQWVANGLWKMRVTKVDPEMDAGNQVGWQVAQGWVNISGRKFAPGNAWMGDEQLVLSNGDTVSSSNTTITTLKAQQLVGHSTDPGASFTHVQNFRYFRPAFDPSNKPVRLLVVFDEGAYKYFNGKPMPVIPPNFRISFDCKK